MRAFQDAAAAFCIACICAEVITLLVDAGWARRCIKAAAGLYILVVLFRLVPGMKLELRKEAAVSPVSVRLQDCEEAIVQRAQQQLQQQLCIDCLQRFGAAIQLQITLRETGQTVQVQQVKVQFPEGCSAAVRGQVTAYLQQELGTEPVLEKQEDAG